MDEFVVPLEECSLDDRDDVFALKDSSGQRYRRVKMFVTSSTTVRSFVSHLSCFDGLLFFSAAMSWTL